jgi:hypothetical protein
MAEVYTKFTMGAMCILGFILVATTTKPAAAWSPSWCASGQDGHPTPAGNAWCANHYPQPVPHPQPGPAPISIAQQHQQQQSQTNSASASGGNANVVNSVSVGGYQGQDNLPVAPLAGCDSGASISVGGSVGHDSGFMPMSNTTVYAAATFPIGRRHCQPVYEAPVVAAPIVEAYPAPVQMATPVLQRIPRTTPSCTYMSDHTRHSILAEVHRLRKTYQTSLIARDLAALHAACVPDAEVARAIDG